MSEKVAEAIVDFANAIEAACIQLKRYVGETQALGVKEETFSKLLGWEKSKGNRLGEFEVTSRKTNNNSNAFNHAYNILKANHASIGNRFHDKGYQFGYWLFDGKPDTIYKQIFKGK